MALVLLQCGHALRGVCICIVPFYSTLCAVHATQHSTQYGTGPEGCVFASHAIEVSRGLRCRFWPESCCLMLPTGSKSHPFACNLQGKPGQESEARQMHDPVGFGFVSIQVFFFIFNINNNILLVLDDNKSILCNAIVNGLL